jgi:pyruvate formate lyase activating enzyme
MDSDTHERFTGVGNSLILDNIKRLSKSGKEIVIRIPVVCGFNDDEANMEATGKFIASLSSVSRVDILPYNRGGTEKSARLISDMELMQANIPDEQQIDSIAHTLNDCGLEVKIGG